MSDFQSIEEYKAHKAEKHAEMLKKQRVPYSIKRKMSESRIRDFIYYLKEIAECQANEPGCEIHQDFL